MVRATAARSGAATLEGMAAGRSLLAAALAGWLAILNWPEGRRIRDAPFFAFVVFLLLIAVLNVVRSALSRRRQVFALTSRRAIVIAGMRSRQVRSV